MKRYISLIIAALLVLCFFSGCGKTVPELPKLTEETPVPVEPEETLPVLELPEPVLPTEAEQRVYIESKYDEWKQQDDYYGWAYLICDMDHNGRLEVISASLQGTGMYTYADYYEVKPGCTGLEKLPTDRAEGDSWPDIMKDGDIPCYHDLATNKYWYVYDDIVRCAAWEHYVIKEAVCLYDGSVSHVVIAQCHTVGDENGNETSEYTDHNGVTISEEEFNASAGKFFADMQQESYNAVWVRVGDEFLREPELIYAADLFDGYGYYHTRCDKTGTYQFAPVNSDGITWEIYVLDEEFNDAERFIPQVYPCLLENSGSLHINEGQWIYIYCPCNSWTMEEAPEGCGFSWNFTPGN